jgi:hypothetical protein
MKRKHIRLFKHLLLITSFCLALSWLLHESFAPDPSPTHQTFNLEKELQTLPAEQRDAARTKWQTLTETEQQQTQRVIQNLSEEQKQQAIKQLQSAPK